MNAIQRGFPNVNCHATGTTDSYESIVWDSGSPLPSQETLDAWIDANPNISQENRRITVLAFRNRFTLQEKVAIELASQINPNDPLQQRIMAATLKSSISDMDKALFIDLNRPDTRAGVMAFEQYGLIAAGRALIILDAELDSA